MKKINKYPSTTTHHTRHPYFYVIIMIVGFEYLVVGPFPWLIEMSITIFYQQLGMKMVKMMIVIVRRRGW